MQLIQYVYVSVNVTPRNTRRECHYEKERFGFQTLLDPTCGHFQPSGVLIPLFSKVVQRSVRFGVALSYFFIGSQLVGNVAKNGYMLEKNYEDTRTY
jgi:hypothetical protein